MKEKFGKVIIDGKIINLDMVSEDELQKVIEKLEQKESKINEEIDKLLNEDITE